MSSSSLSQSIATFYKCTQCTRKTVNCRFSKGNKLPCEECERDGLICRFPTPSDPVSSTIPTSNYSKDNYGSQAHDLASQVKTLSHSKDERPFSNSSFKAVYGKSYLSFADILHRPQPFHSNLDQIRNHDPSTNNLVNLKHPPDFRDVLLRREFPISQGRRTRVDSKLFHQQVKEWLETPPQEFIKFGKVKEQFNQEDHDLYERFALPEDSFIEAIHDAVSEKYQNDSSMHFSFDSTALLSLSILLDEFIRETVDKDDAKQAYEDVQVGQSINTPWDYIVKPDIIPTEIIRTPNTSKQSKKKRSAQSTPLSSSKVTPASSPNISLLESEQPEQGEGEETSLLDGLGREMNEIDFWGNHRDFMIPHTPVPYSVKQISGSIARNKNLHIQKQLFLESPCASSTIHEKKNMEANLEDNEPFEINENGDKKEKTHNNCIARLVQADSQKKLAVKLHKLRPRACEGCGSIDNVVRKRIPLPDEQVSSTSTLSTKRRVHDMTEKSIVSQQTRKGSSHVNSPRARYVCTQCRLCDLCDFYVVPINECPHHSSLDSPERSSANPIESPIRKKKSRQV